jgi:hypothetical protein
MKNPKAKQACEHACSLLVFVAVILLGVSQLLKEEKYTNDDKPSYPKERAWCDSMVHGSGSGVADNIKCIDYLNNLPDSEKKTATPHHCVGKNSKAGTNCCPAPNGAIGNNGNCWPKCSSDTDPDCQTCGWSEKGGAFMCPLFE